MLGHGVKRKQSCNEAEGLKVYLPEKAEVQAQGGSSYLPHLQQQQLVLSLCLDKLQRSRAELSLHRSVLLVNTLRQIQQVCQVVLTCQPSHSPLTLMHLPTQLTSQTCL